MYKFLMALGLLMVSATANAAPILYECTYNSKGEKGWISDRAYYLIDDAAARASVYDGAVSVANNDKPKVIPLEVRKGNVYVLKYTLRLPARGNYTISADYRVRLDTIRLRASIKVWPGDSDLPDVGGAKCKVAKRN